MTNHGIFAGGPVSETPAWERKNKTTNGTQKSPAFPPGLVHDYAA
jgi:hypothetical protein